MVWIQEWCGQKNAVETDIARQRLGLPNLGILFAVTEY
jgi:hypothetical protein